MFGFGRRKDALPTIPFPLHFKNAEAAVQYASAYMVCDLRMGVELPAVVVDASEAFGVPSAVHRGDDGIQTAMLTVCGKPTGFTALAQTSGSYGPVLQPGDLVTWKPIKLIPEMAKAAQDKRTGWAGLITGVLEPTLNREGWLGRQRFSDRMT